MWPRGEATRKTLVLLLTEPLHPICRARLPYYQYISEKIEASEADFPIRGVYRWVYFRSILPCVLPYILPYILPSVCLSVLTKCLRSLLSLVHLKANWPRSSSKFVVFKTSLRNSSSSCHRDLGCLYRTTSSPLLLLLSRPRQKRRLSSSARRRQQRQQQ